MTHLAIIDPLSKHGGIHYYVHDLANALDAHGVTVDVFSPPTGLDQSATYSHHTAFEGVYGLSGGSKLVRARRLMFDMARSVRRAKSRGNDAVLLHIFKSDAFECAAILLARSLRMRVFAIVHDVTRLDTQARISFSGFIAQSVTGIVVHNEFSREALLQSAPAALDKVRIIPHGNYVDRFPNPPAMDVARARLGVPANSLVLLFFGNPRREKGLGVLLEALKQFATRKDILLLVAGKMKPEDELELRAYIGEHQLEDVIRLDIGHVSDEDVPNYYRAASMVVLPYLRVYESGVALMAMSFARPILASDLPVFADIVEEGRGGELFRVGDSVELAAAIEGLLQKKVDYKQMGENGLRFATEHRSWNNSGSLLAKFIAHSG